MSTRSAMETSRDPSAMASPYAGRILVIEDEPDMAFGLAHNLGFEGYEVAVAETAQAGLEVYRSFHPALILLDLRLPDMHGMEVLRAIRSASTDVRIMIVSCLDAPEERADGFVNGANDYLVKPFGLTELLARGTLSGQRSVAGFRDIAEKLDVSRRKSASRTPSSAPN